MQKIVLLLFVSSVFYSQYSYTELDNNSQPQYPNIVSNAPNRVLFLMQGGNLSQALKLYREYVKQIGHHDPDLLQHMGQILLEQGFRTKDPEIQLLTLFGAGISFNEKTMHLLEEGLKSSQPELQLASLNFLARFQNDDADLALNKALTSNYLVIRLEGVYQLAKRKAPTALGQTEALMCKVPSEIHFLFPQLYGMIGTPQAIKSLRRLLSHKEEKVRIEAILSAAKFKRDDLLPSIRSLMTHHVTAQQEACAYAVGVLKDEASVPKLIELSQSGLSTTRLSALQALYSLGRLETKGAIESAANAQDVFAINILGGIQDSNNTLYALTQSPNIQVKVNATLALLNRRDSRCLNALCDLLIRDPRDLALGKISSQGNALEAYKVIPSAQQNLQDNTVGIEMSLGIMEDALQDALDLPEKDFLRIAQVLLEAQQNALVPAVVEALEDLHTPDAIALLKKHQQRIGAPLIRNYCNLALYNLKEEGPYADNIKIWIAKQYQEELIRFRPLVPRDIREEDSPYELTPNEASGLLIKCLEALAQHQDEHGIDILLDAIQYGNSKNKYALTGLLMRAAQ